MRSLDPVTLIGNWLRAAASPAGRRVLLLTFLIDAPFAFVFLIAVQTYLPEQTLMGTSLPGLCLALFGGGKLVAQYVGGRLTDHLGLRSATVAGLALIVAAQAGFLLSTVAIVIALLASAAYGAGSAIVWPAVFARASRFPNETRAQISAAMTVTSGAGMASALALGWLLPEDLSFGLAIAATLVLVTVAFVLALFAGEPADPDDDERETASRVLGLRDVFAHPPMLKLGGVIFLQSASVAAMMSIFRAIGRDLLDVSLREQMILFVGPAAGFGAGIALAGLVGGIVGRRNMLAVAYLTSAVSFVLLPTAGAGVLGPSMVLLTTGCLGMGLAMPTTTAASFDLARVTPGVTFGFLLTLEGIGHALGPAGGALFGTVEGTLMFMAALQMVAFFTSLTMAPKNQPDFRPVKLPADVAASTVEV
jgi:predicted MFS family arabinose efflux permease